MDFENPKSSRTFFPLCISLIFRCGYPYPWHPSCVWNFCLKKGCVWTFGFNWSKTLDIQILIGLLRWLSPCLFGLLSIFWTTSFQDVQKSNAPKSQKLKHMAGCLWLLRTFWLSEITMPTARCWYWIFQQSRVAVTVLLFNSKDNCSQFGSEFQLSLQSPWSKFNTCGSEQQLNRQKYFCWWGSPII